MLRDENIIYFGNDWNADNKTSSHHVAEYLSKENRLLYVESPGMRTPRTSSRDLRRILSKFIMWIKSPRPVNDHFYVATLFLLPFHKFDAIRKINRLLIISSLRFLCMKLKFYNPILWIFLPHMELVVGSLGEKMVVYYCTDNYEALPKVDSKSISLMEKRLLKKADIVFAVNEQLVSKVSKINTNVYISPHGVDLEHFGKALEPDLRIPEDVSNIRRPIIGFFGLIEEWIDQELINFLAQSRPSWSFVLVGRAAVNVNKIASLQNVYLLGQRKYDDLPAYAKSFDVAIIPYVINEQTLNCNPLKLREYLSSGKPVVAVSVPEIRKYSDIVKVAESYDDFLNKIEESLRENGHELIRRRVERMRSESWDARVERVSNIVDEALKKKINLGI